MGQTEAVRPKIWLWWLKWLWLSDKLLVMFLVCYGAALQSSCQCHLQKSTHNYIIIFLNRTTFINLICGFTFKQSTAAGDCISWLQTPFIIWSQKQCKKQTDKWKMKVLTTVYSFALDPGFITTASERKYQVIHQEKVAVKLKTKSQTGYLLCSEWR